jgi:hypothetical protein
MNKRINLSVFAAAGLMTIGMTGTAFALHGGGVAHCDACHSMHATTIASGATANSVLLKGSDASSTCLNCHESTDGKGYHISSPDGSATGQGGDFYWMKNDYTATIRGTVNTSHAATHGHSIVATDFGFAADSDNLTAPGGSYDATKLGCTSCHDAHGQVNGGTKNGSLPISASGSTSTADAEAGSILGNYRLLGDAVYLAGGVDDQHAFTNGAPVAVGRNITGASYNAQVDYGSGMSEWCANCHGDFLGAADNMHPAGNGVDLGSYVGNYNSYVATGDFTGTQDIAYDALVPFERGTALRSELNPQSTVGPNANSNVMCLTCHRAHGSAFEHGTRWDMEAELLVTKGIYALSTDVPATAAAYYKNGAKVDIVTAYGPWQRSLCNKCHVQD